MDVDIHGYIHAEASKSSSRILEFEFELLEFLLDEILL